MEASRFSQAFSSFWNPYRAYQLVLDGQQRLQWELDQMAAKHGKVVSA
jgi:hypothetical protein